MNITSAKSQMEEKKQSKYQWHKIGHMRMCNQMENQTIDQNIKNTIWDTWECVTKQRKSFNQSIKTSNT